MKIDESMKIHERLEAKRPIPSLPRYAPPLERQLQLKETLDHENDQYIGELKQQMQKQESLESLI